MITDLSQLPDDFIQLARLALTGRPQDVQLFIHRVSKKYRDVSPKMTDSLISLLQESPSRSSPLRKQMDTPLPVDIDSRLQLLKLESGQVEHVPILSSKNEIFVSQILSERKNSTSLLKSGLHPTKSILFTGPPGVGKTLAAKWIAYQLGRPLLVLDLAAVMSSFLGRTGNNIRYVLDYAKNTDCILLLDELDAIAKRRDDASEIGELKRLVTVLLQEIDDWPSTGLLIAATNHPDLLDHAVWRRFEMILDFDKPDRGQTEILIRKLLEREIEHVDKWVKILSYLLSGKSYSEIERQVMLLRKTSVIMNRPLDDVIPNLIQQNSNLKKHERLQLAVLLEETGSVSQRQAHEITGISRDTIRKYRDEKSVAEKITLRKVKGRDVKKQSTKKRIKK